MEGHVASVAAAYARAAMAGAEDPKAAARTAWEHGWSFDEEDAPELSAAAWAHALEIGEALVEQRAKEPAPSGGVEAVEQTKGT